jgi:hypothetical protein
VWATSPGVNSDSWRLVTAGRRSRSLAGSICTVLCPLTALAIGAGVGWLSARLPSVFGRALLEGFGALGPAAHWYLFGEVHRVSKATDRHVSSFPESRRCHAAPSLAEDPLLRARLRTPRQRHARQTRRWRRAAAEDVVKQVDRVRDVEGCVPVDVEKGSVCFGGRAR